MKRRACGVGAMPLTAGFTLIEVMVALIITSTGLLGLARMQALAISSTKESGTRALIALQTSSLGALMHANPAFWAQGLAPASFRASGTTIIDSTATLTGGTAGGCTTPCTPAQLAAVDVMNWVVDMNNQFPTYSAQVNCTTVMPVNCEIFVTWTERIVAMNQTTAMGASTQASTESFLEYIQP